jgi:hypothetical protein
VTAQRWSVEQVFALAPKPSSVAAAQPLAVPARWRELGCDDDAVWGRCQGSGTEPYDTAVDHVAVASRCTCPSRVFPCKHALALLLLWARGQVVEATVPERVSSWVSRRRSSPSTGAPAATDVAPPGDDSPATPSESIADPLPPTPVDPSTTRDERVARMRAGLAELQRWLADRMRAGLTDPALARYATWDDLAARLVDAQVGGLANRVRRIAGLVGTTPHWHDAVLAELAAVHLLASGGQRLAELPPDLADAVAVALGWQVRQADVLGGVPETDHWEVRGRSDTREDRIEVRRVWMYGRASRRWAMLLSFAAYQQTLDDSWVVGTTVSCDLYRYPGALGLRALAGARHGEPVPYHDLADVTVADACNAVGSMLASEPWIERLPVTVTAAPTRRDGSWLLSDRTGAVPVVASNGVGRLLACSAGAPVTTTCEWTAAGLVPLTVHLADRAVDVGPVADASFVGAAS